MGGDDCRVFSILILLARLVPDLRSPGSEFEGDAIVAHNIESLRSPVNSGNIQK